MSTWVVYSQKASVRRWRIATYQLCTKKGIAAYFLWNSRLRMVVGNAIYADSDGNRRYLDKSQFKFMTIYEVKKRFEVLARMEGHQ